MISGAAAATLITMSHNFTVAITLVCRTERVLENCMLNNGCNPSAEGVPSLPSLA